MTRQPDFSADARPSRLPRLDATGIALAVLLLGAALVGSWRVRAQADEARTHLAQTQAESARLAARLAAAPGQASGAAPGLPAPTRVAAALAALLPPRVRLESLSIGSDARAAGVRLELQVVARDAAAWDALLEQLGRATELREVESGPETREGEIRSFVRARWSGGMR